MIFLLRGWTKPFERYARHIGSFPQFSGWTWNIFELPPPRFWVGILLKVAGIWNRALASFASWIQPCRMRKRNAVRYFQDIFLGRKRSWKTPKFFFLVASITRKKSGWISGWMRVFLLSCFFFLLLLFWNVPVIWGVGDDEGDHTVVDFFNKNWSWRGLQRVSNAIEYQYRIYSMEMSCQFSHLASGTQFE